MQSAAKEVDETYFLEGLSSARAGLAEETCPYEYVAENSVTSGSQIRAPSNWRLGWKYGRYIAIQRARKEKTVEILNALRDLFRHEDTHCKQCEILNRGLLKAGLKFIAAQRESAKLAAQIRTSKSFRLLKDLYIDLYLPWRPEEYPYKFKVFDRQLNIFGDEERTFRRLVQIYGERHGVQAAWYEYVRTDSIESLVATIAR